MNDLIEKIIKAGPIVRNIYGDKVAYLLSKQDAQNILEAVGLKDHEVAIFVNKLTATANEHCHTGQLRSHIRQCVYNHLPQSWQSITPHKKYNKH